MSADTHLFLSLGAAAMAAAVALGAFGAHALRTRVGPEQLALWSTAVQYHVYHAFGLMVVAGVAHLLPGNAWVRWSAWLMAGGIVAFSASLYLLVLFGIRWLGAVTPVGGLAFLAAWVLLGVGACRG